MAENIVETLTTEMMEHICDNLCKHPLRVGQTQEELEHICNQCKIGLYMRGVSKAYHMVIEEIQEYRAIGTVAECREAVERQQAKKPIYENASSATKEIPKAIPKAVFSFFYPS